MYLEYVKTKNWSASDSGNTYWSTEGYNWASYAQALLVIHIISRASNSSFLSIFWHCRYDFTIVPEAEPTYTEPICLYYSWIKPVHSLVKSATSSNLYLSYFCYKPITSFRAFPSVQLLVILQFPLYFSHTLVR